VVSVMDFSTRMRKLSELYRESLDPSRLPFAQGLRSTTSIAAISSAANCSTLRCRDQRIGLSNDRTERPSHLQAFRKTVNGITSPSVGT